MNRICNRNIFDDGELRAVKSLFNGRDKRQSKGSENQHGGLRENFHIISY